MTLYDSITETIGETPLVRLNRMSPPGTHVYVKKVAPLGDPIELTVRGYELSIRRDEAANVEVTDVRTGE